MSFVTRELDRISARLLDPALLPEGEYERLYAAQQALSWALEPIGFKSPYDMITRGIPKGSEGCPSSSYHDPS
jgi:hypothetical protein